MRPRLLLQNVIEREARMLKLCSVAPRTSDENLTHCFVPLVFRVRFLKAILSDSSSPYSKMNQNTGRLFDIYDKRVENLNFLLL